MLLFKRRGLRSLEFSFLQKAIHHRQSCNALWQDIIQIHVYNLHLCIFFVAYAEHTPFVVWVWMMRCNVVVQLGLLLFWVLYKTKSYRKK